MQSAQTTNQAHPFSRQIIGLLKSGIRKNERFEQLSTEILNNISNQLLMVDDHQSRKIALSNYYLELERAEKIRRFHMMYESPTNNKQLNAALNHLKSQFKLRFSKYFS